MSFKLADELERRAAYPYVRGILLISTTADGIMIMIIDQEDVEPLRRSLVWTEALLN